MRETSQNSRELNDRQHCCFKANIIWLFYFTVDRVSPNVAKQLSFGRLMDIIFYSEITLCCQDGDRYYQHAFSQRRNPVACSHFDAGV